MSDILRESLERIIGLAGAAQRAQILPCPAMPRDRVLIEHQPGNVQGFDIPRGPVKDGASTIAGLCQQINATGEDPGVCSVYVGNDRVRVVFDDDRRDSIEMALPWSEPFATLSKAEAITGLPQRELVWLLRTTFRGVFAPAELLPTVRKITFKAAGQSDTEIQHGRESMGKALQQEAIGAGAIPEEVRFTVPVFADLVHEENFFSANVLCALDIDLEKQRFTLKPLPDELAVARRRANVWLCERIRSLCFKALVFEASSAG